MSFKVFWSKYGRTILRGVSIGATVAAPVVTAIVVPKVQKKLHKLKEEGKNSKGDKIKACLPEVAAVAGLTALGVGTGIAADSMANSAIAASNAILAAERAAKKATNDVLIESLPEKKLEEVQKAIAKKQDETVPAAAKVKTANVEYTIDTGHGAVEFKDMWSRQIFLSDWNFIQSKMNEYNARINDGYDVTTNMWLNSIGLDGVDAGDGYYFPNGIKYANIQWITNEKGQPRGILTFADGYEPKPVTRKLSLI